MASENPINLRECPFCGNGVWRLEATTAYLEHRPGCFFAGFIVILIGSHRAQQWNNRVDCKILPQSPVNANPEEEAFYNWAETELKKDLDKTTEKDWKDIKL